ncbi:MAG TPA: hypothetical protein VIK70_02155 [Lysobacter sp.]
MKKIGYPAAPSSPWGESNALVQGRECLRPRRHALVPANLIAFGVYP